MVHNDEVLRRLALGPGVEDRVLAEEKIVAKAIAAEQARIWGQERVAGLINEFTESKRGRPIELGPSVDDFPLDLGQQITDEINADSDEVEQLRAARIQAQAGQTQSADDFFEEDEPVEDVVAEFEAGDKMLTEPPTGVGWCSPSP